MQTINRIPVFFQAQKTMLMFETIIGRVGFSAEYEGATVLERTLHFKEQSNLGFGSTFYMLLIAPLGLYCTIQR